MGFNFENKDISEKATIAMISKRVNAMRILLFLMKDEKNEEAYYLQALADELDMNEMTAFNNLNKLMDAGLVEKSEAKGNRKNKYYAIVNRELSEKVIEKYKHAVGFQLARLIPYERRYCSQLKEDKHFQNACKEYGLTISEGFSEVLSCHKIGKDSSNGTDTIIWRNAQGYDELEKENLVEAEDI